MNGLAVSRCRSASRSVSRWPSAAAAEMGRPPSRTSAAASVAVRAGPSSGCFRTSLARRASRLSTVWRSARISSVLTVSMSSGRVDPALDVDHVVVVEGSHHLADGVGLADGRQELVAQPLALRGAPHDPGDVDERHRGRHDPHAVVQVGQSGEPGSRAPPPRPRWRRWWRTDSWPPAPRSGSGR